MWMNRRFVRAVSPNDNAVAPSAPSSLKLREETCGTQKLGRGSTKERRSWRGSSWRYRSNQQQSLACTRARPRRRSLGQRLAQRIAGHHRPPIRSLTRGERIATPNGSQPRRRAVAPRLVCALLAFTRALFMRPFIHRLLSLLPAFLPPSLPLSLLLLGPSLTRIL